jgi:hypothetical protein
MKIKSSVTISRGSDDKVRIAIECDESHTRFVETIMDLESFARAITGQGYIHCDAIVRGLEFVGKRKIIETRSIESPNLGYGREAYREWLKNEYREDGWTVDDYLGSQGSISIGTEKTYLKFSVYRYEKLEE